MNKYVPIILIVIASAAKQSSVLAGHWIASLRSQ